MLKEPSFLEVRTRDRALSEVLYGTRLERHLPVLAKAKIVRATDVLHRGAELTTVLKNVTSEELSEMRQLCGQLFSPDMETPLTMQMPLRLSWGSQTIDELFGGGLCMNGIVELAGVAGAGKTQLALWLTGQALAANPTSRVVYIGTEGEFPARRFVQMHGESIPDAASRVMVEQASSFDELWILLTTRVPVMLNRFGATLLVIDSIGALRSDYDFSNNADRSARTTHLWRVGQYLKFLSDRYQCGVLVTNQMRADMQAADKMLIGGQDAVTPALGLVWANCVNTRIIVSKTRQTTAEQGAIVRQMSVELSSSLPKFPILFVVTASGIESAEI